MILKQKRAITILVLAVTALVAILLCVNAYQKHQEKLEGEALQAAAQVGVITDSASTYTSLSYDNGAATLSFALDENGAWFWADDPDFPLDATYLTKITETLAGLKPQQTITDGDTLEAYGLTEPAQTLTATAENGQVTTIAMGKSTTDGTSAYMLMNGQESPVYIIANTLKTEISTGIYAMMLLPELPNLQESRLTAVTISGETETVLTATHQQTGAAPDADASAETSAVSGTNDAAEGTTSWRSGGKDVTAEAKVAEVIAQVTALRLQSCVDYKPTEKATTLCGFDEPTATISVVYNDDADISKTLTMHIGSVTLDGAGRHVRVDDDATIYSIAAENLDTLMGVSVNGLTDAPAGE